MGEVVYTCRTRVERLRGPLRRDTVPGSDEPIWFGVHDEVADHYGVERDGEAEHMVGERRGDAWEGRRHEHRVVGGVLGEA